jgi:hypothetical protein
MTTLLQFWKREQKERERKKERKRGKERERDEHKKKEKEKGDQSLRRLHCAALTQNTHWLSPQPTGAKDNKSPFKRHTTRWGRIELGA